MSGNFFETLHEGFAARLDEVFLALPTGEAQTYGAIARRSARLAAVLRRAGATPGDRVVVQVDKSPDAIALYLACLRLGVVYIPLNVAYTGSELAYVLEDASPRVLVCRPDTETTLAPLARRHGVERVFTLGTSENGSLGAEATRQRESDIVEPRAESDPAAMLYTSGTTGSPKGAMITHLNLSSNARALFETWGWRPDDVLLHALPVFHVHGLFVALHCAMLAGSRVEFLPRFDPGAVRAALPRTSVMMGVPTFYRRLLGEPGFDRDECAHMRLFISGSAPLAETLFRAFAEHTGHAVLERYGLTETGILTSNPLAGERVAGTVGHPLPGVELRVVRDDGTTCAPGESGAVEVRGPGVFAGYWNDPEKTRAAFRKDGFFATGDLGFRAHDGRLTLVGRASELILCGGYNVYPKEIERRLDEIPGIVESAVVGLPHPDLGEAVAAFLVRDGPSPTEAAVRTALERRLARFKHPRLVSFVDQLPRNAMGKVTKHELRRRHASAFGGG